MRDPAVSGTLQPPTHGASNLPNGKTAWDGSSQLPRVLFVDDDAICRRHFEVLLGSRGIMVDVAASADEAIGFARRHQYRVIVSDLIMPRLDGMAVIERVRPTQTDARYLVTTAAEPMQARGMLHAAQLDGVLWKPWDVGLLLAVLERLVTRPGQTHSIPPGVPLNGTDAVLIVAQDELEVQRLTSLLRGGLSSGVPITVAGSLAEAVAQVISDAVKPALVLLDVRLPDSDGLHAVMRLNELGLEAPIIVIGDSADEVLAVQAVQAGAQDYLVREQADERRLLRTIRQALGRKNSQLKLTRGALYDRLTGAANRVLFERRTEQAVLSARAHGKSFALMFVDLDRFKAVNDDHGHDVGDALLSAFAMRLADCLNASDLLARLGGDEFAILSQRIESRPEALVLAAALREALVAPFELGGHTLSVSASVGLALFPEDGSNEKELLRSADVAMYQAKGHGRRGAHDPGRDNLDSERRRIAQSLRPALERGEFLLHFQPIVDLHMREPIAVEAFLRWQLADGHLLLPSAFLRVLDETGMIIPVGRWVLKDACREIARFRAVTGRNLRLSVNCSAIQVADRNFVRDLTATLAHRNSDPDSLDIDLSETTLSMKSEAVAESLRQLRELGVGLCMDDFGSGISSLTELRRAGLRSLKIDRSLIHDLKGSQEARATVQAIVILGRGLGLRVVAEGVEHEVQHQLLRELGCDYAQGLLYGAPVNSDELCTLFTRAQAPAERA
jgi:diguanylate cyclase (GGDEF)-like protein